MAEPSRGIGVQTPTAAAEPAPATAAETAPVTAAETTPGEAEGKALALDGPAGSSLVEAANEISRSLLRMVELVAEHLEYWESLAQAPPRRQLTSVLFRRGPLHFVHSFVQILSTKAVPLPAGRPAGTEPQAGAPSLLLRAQNALTSSVSQLAQVLSATLPVKFLGISQSDSAEPLKSASTESRKSTLSAESVPANQSTESSATRHQQSEVFASAFVAERVDLLRSLKSRLLKALGLVWAAYSLDGAPPLLTFGPDGALGMMRQRSLPPQFLAEAHQKCLAAIKGLQASFTFPSRAHGPFASALGEGALLALSLHVAGDPAQNALPASLALQAKALTAFTQELVSHYGRPGVLSRHWVECTAVGLGLVLTSSYISKHRGAILSWCSKAKDSALVFATEHIVNPLIAIRDDIFVTFRTHHDERGISTDFNQSTQTLHRMLEAFVFGAREASVEWAKGKESEPGRGDASPAQPRSLSDSELMAVVMSTYEKEVTRPLQSLATGRLAQALLIQVQQMKVNTESAMVELEHILKANQINFAILAALPALLLALAAVSLSRDWLYSQSRGAIGRGKAAQRARRMLLADVERIVLRQLADLEVKQKAGGPEAQMEEVYGALVYALFRLYKGVKAEAQRCGEWRSLDADIQDATRPIVGSQSKALLLARMSRAYDCFSMARPSALSGL